MCLLPPRNTAIIVKMKESALITRATIIHDRQQLILNDVLFQLNLKTRQVESPKAVLFAKFLGGDAVLPLDKELFEQLKNERKRPCSKGLETREQDKECGYDYMLKQCPKWLGVHLMRRIKPIRHRRHGVESVAILHKWQCKQDAITRSEHYRSFHDALQFR